MNSSAYFSIYDTAAAAERLNIDTSGRVGIGMTPSEQLSVITSTPYAAAFNTTVTSAATTVLAIGGYSGAGGGTGGTVGIGSVHNHATTTAAAMVFNTSGAGSVGCLERMRITGDGDVGIGRTPSYRLDVIPTGYSNTTPMARFGYGNGEVLLYSAVDTNPGNVWTPRTVMTLAAEGTSGYAYSQRANLRVAANGAIGGVTDWLKATMSINFQSASDGYASSSPEVLTLFGTGNAAISGDTMRVATAKTPASASAAGTTGDICWDANYVYVCVATNTWKRTALTTW